jgi:hypothetical protein
VTVETTETRAPADPGHEPRSVLRRVAVPLGALAAVVAAFGYVGAVDPNEPGHYPTCPFLQLTGAYCPGCGGLRSAHAVAHGDFAAAVGDNALAVAGYVLFAVVWAVWVIRAARGKPLAVGLGRGHLWAVGTVLVAFTVVRNLPFGAFLNP